MRKRSCESQTNYKISLKYNELQRSGNLAPVFLGGPTASGKSATALELAVIISGEIISVDSMQVYQGMDIGTSKASPEDQARVPHHLIDVAALSERFDAAQFAARARQACKEIIARGRVPIFCGGTGLYFKAYLEGLGAAPPRDPQLRQRLEAMPLSELLAELAHGDPVHFQKIDRANRRRVVRAVEVIRLTGRPFSEQRDPWRTKTNSAPAPAFYILDRQAGELRKRIDERVELMFRRGIVEETERLLKKGLAENPSAMQSLGYRQVVEHLQGQRGLDETIELVKVRTRQFAKRQRTWFRHQTEGDWIDLSSIQSERQVALRIAADVRSGTGQ